MTLSPTMARDVERLIEMRNQEAYHRQWGRNAELNGRMNLAHEHFTIASRLRDERLALLDRCGLR